MSKNELIDKNEGTDASSIINNNICMVCVSYFVVTSDEVLILTLLMQKLVILEQLEQWKKLAEMDEFRRNFGGADI